MCDKKCGSPLTPNQTSTGNTRSVAIDCIWNMQCFIQSPRGIKSRRVQLFCLICFMFSVPVVTQAYTALSLRCAMGELQRHSWHMMTSSNGNIFRVTGHLSPVNSPRKGQWRGALIFSLICVWINGWVNNRALRRYRTHYDVTVMLATSVAAAIAHVWSLFC